MNSAVVSSTTRVLNNILRFVLLKGYPVNFFAAQILPTNIYQFLFDRTENKLLVAHHYGSLAFMLTETIAG